MAKLGVIYPQDILISSDITEFGDDLFVFGTLYLFIHTKHFMVFGSALFKHVQMSPATTGIFRAVGVGKGFDLANINTVFIFFFDKHRHAHRHNDRLCVGCINGGNTGG